MYSNSINCSVTFPGNVQSDAITVTVSTDPPGQACRYIPPGDTSSEMYRLSTFRDSSIQLQKTRHLAKIGFFYTGYKDRIKCFSCGQYIEDLTVDEDFTHARWHRDGCFIPEGGDPSNKPMLLCANTSAGRDLSSHLSVRVSTQRPTTNNAPSDVTSNEQSSDLSQLFPCQHAISPHMARVEERLETFTSQVVHWSANNTVASHPDMAEAGLFYIGDKDRVKCWYCNGGLQNWLPQDNPWYEHAKWFPTCEFVLQQKGPDYVHRICERFPNLQRPVVPTSVNHNSRNVLSGLSSTAIYEPPQIIDDREEMRRRNRTRVDTEMESSTLVGQAKELGFGEGQIRTAIMKCFETNDRLCTGFEELLDLILEYGDQNQ